MSSDENDKSSEQILEYYKKYSQNRNLPKYFSGTSVSYLPPIAVEKDDNEPSDRDQPNQPVHISEINIIVDDASSGSSSGSPSEHKKLEWDNGADIGYDSARKNSEMRVQKSSSLPTLSKLKELIPASKPSTIITHSTSSKNVEVLLYGNSNSSSQSSSKCSSSKQESASSHSTEKVKEPLSSSSTSTTSESKLGSSSNSYETRLVDFQSTIDYLKQKIGLPGAQSTPNIVDHQLISCSRSSKSSLAKNLSSKSKSDGATEEFNKAETKSSSLSSHSPCKVPVKDTKSKIVELSVTTPINVNCNCLGVVSSDKNVQTVPKTNNISDDVADLASSFEYISVDKNAKVLKLTKSHQDIISIRSTTTGVSGVIEEVSILKNSTESSSSLLRTSSDDIDRHLEVLHKLLKAKKLNSRTKRRYLKVLLKDLTELETSNDSTTSSELFVPVQSGKVTRKCKVAFRDADDVKIKRHTSSFPCSSDDKVVYGHHQASTTSSSPALASDTLNKDHQQDVHANTNVQRSESVQNKLTTDSGGSKESSGAKSSNTDGQEVSNGDLHSEYSAQVKFTCEETSSSKDFNQTRLSSTKSGFVELFAEYSAGADQKLADQMKIDRTIQFPSATCSCAEVPAEYDVATMANTGAHSNRCVLQDQNVQTWHQHTRSVQSSSVSPPLQEATKEESSGASKPLLQGGTSTKSDATRFSSKVSDDYLLKFAENERAYQLNWINNEICHLSKLKSILEVKSSTAARPKTSQYHVTQKSGSTKTSERNYVIQTNLGDVPAERKINYVLDGKEYVVSRSSDEDKATVADIKINSNGQQTNIQVSPVCSVCRRVVCVCGSEMTTINSKLSSLSTEPKENGATKDLGIEQGSNGASVEGDASPQLSETAYLSSEDYNSLQRMFKKCSCSSKNPNCGCDFLKNLLNKFLDNTAQTDSSPPVQRAAEAQTDIRPATLSTAVQGQIADDVACQTRTLCQQTMLQICIPPENNAGKPISLQTLKDVFSQYTQTEIDVASNKTQTNGDRLTLHSRSELNSHQDNIDGLPSAEGEAFRSSRGKRDVATYEGEQKVTQTEEKPLETKNIGIQAIPSLDPGKDDGLKGGDPRKVEQRGTDRTVLANSSSHSSNIASDSKSSASSRVTCSCCKQKAFLAEISYLEEGNDGPVLCSRCFYQHPRYCRHNPQFACRCWSYWRSARHCKCCQKEASRCARKPVGGLMYTVTLPIKKRRSSRGGVDNIKVQKGWSGKSLKNKENDDRKNGLKKEVDGDKDLHKEKRQKDDAQYTLMEYLIRNRPEFVYSAEYRRQTLLNSRILRERQKDNWKLDFLENNLGNNNGGKYKLFTEREMKEINKKNYKRLPEVQRNLVNQRESRLRQADRLISNALAKKVQKSVLQGRGNFPIDKPLTNL